MDRIYKMDRIGNTSTQRVLREHQAPHATRIRRMGLAGPEGRETRDEKWAAKNVARRAWLPGKLASWGPHLLTQRADSSRDS